MTLIISIFLFLRSFSATAEGAANAFQDAAEDLDEYEKGGEDQEHEYEETGTFLAVCSG